jgi:hypothetical protein
MSLGEIRGTEDSAEACILRLRGVVFIGNSLDGYLQLDGSDSFFHSHLWCNVALVTKVFHGRAVRYLSCVRSNDG